MNSAGIVIFAPMTVEARPVARRLGLTARDGSHAGRIAATDVRVVLAGVGPSPSAATARRVIGETSPEHVLVVGVAGGIGRELSVADVIVPATVIDGGTGVSFDSHPFRSLEVAGSIVTTVDLLDDAALIERFPGCDAVDMESAAIAGVCEQLGVPWSVIRGISDLTREATVPADAMTFLRPDGRPDLGGVAKHLLRHPTAIVGLARLGRDTNRAMAAASETLAQAFEA